MNSICLTASNVVSGTHNASYVYKFPSSAVFGNHSIALAGLTCYSCVFNVTAALGNNKLSLVIYPADAYALPYNIVIPDGSYTVDALNSYFQYYSIQNGLYMIDAVGSYHYFASFAINAVKYAIEVQTFSIPVNGTFDGLPLGWYLPSNFPVAVGAGTYWNPVITFPSGMSEYFGFAAGFSTAPNSGLTTTLAYLSTIAPQINPNPSVLVSVTGISNKFAVSPIIYSFSSAGVAFGSMISEKPNNLLWCSLNSGTYSEIRVTFLGSDFRPLTMLDPSITMLLAIKPNSSLL